MEDVAIDIGENVTISNAYMLGLDETFKLVVLCDEEIMEQPFQIGGISLDSFEQRQGKWFTVVPANEAAGFSHPVIIGFGNRTGDVTSDFNALEDTLIVEGSNEGVTYANSDSYEKQINERFAGEISVMIGERNALPFMISMFPRPIQDGLLYTHALDRDT